MPRNRSVSPQKMPSNQSTVGENNPGQLNLKEKERLLKEIQEMFTGTVEPEVVHLVLTECEWRVDEAIETIFTMVPVEGKSEEEDLQMIACALIGDAEDGHNSRKSVSMTTAKNSTMRKTRDKDMTSSTVTSDKTRFTDKDTQRKEFSRLSDSQQTSDHVEDSYDSFQSYMTMSEIYGGYTPEMIGAMTLGVGTTSDISMSSRENNQGSASTVSGITDIDLCDKLSSVDTAVSTSGKKDTCSPDQGYEKILGDMQKTNDSGQSEMSENLEKSRVLKDDATKLGSHSVISEKGGNSGDILSTDAGQSVVDDFSRTEEKTEMCPSVSAMFSAFKSVQDKLGDSNYKSSSNTDPDFDKMSPQFNLDAPAFVPRFSAPPPNRPPPPGYDFPPWSNQPPGPLPMFFTPKGPMHSPRGPPGPRPRFDNFFHPRFRPRHDPPNGQPRPLQPLFAVSPGSQFKRGNSGQPQVPPSSWPEEIPESFPHQTGQFSGMSSSEKVSKEPKLIPDWAKIADGEQTVSMATETSCSEHVQKVKSFLDRGRLLMVLMRGLPGSGKSFLAREIVFDGVVLSTDDYFYRCGEYNYKQDLLTEAHTWNKARARNAMDEKVNPVIIDNTNTMEWEMLPYVKLALARGYAVQVMEPDTPWRFQPKILCKKNSHGVSKDVIRKMNQRYQHHITVSSMIAAVNKQQFMFDARRCKTQEPAVQVPAREATEDQAPVTHTSAKKTTSMEAPAQKTPAHEVPADQNSNIKLVEYETSSDEDEEKRVKLPQTKNTPAPIPTLLPQAKTKSDIKTKSKTPALIPTLSQAKVSGKIAIKKQPPPIQPLISKVKQDKDEAQNDSIKNGNKRKSGMKTLSQPTPLPISSSQFKAQQVIPKLKMEENDRLQSPSSNKRSGKNDNSNGDNSNSKTNENICSKNSSNNNSTSSKSRNSSSSSNNSVPNSPRKRKRKKRRPSSSKSEVIQAIEEILNCCEEGEVTPVDLKAREEEIEALLFMSHVSDDDKKEIELWFKERLESLKNKEKVVGHATEGEVGKVNDKPGSKEVEVAEKDENKPSDMKIDIKEVFQRTFEEHFDETLTSELDNIVSSDFSKILEFAKSAFTQECGNVAEEDIADVLEEISKLKQTKEPEVSIEDEEDDEDDPWLQGGPKPRRSRSRRISQDDKDEIKEKQSGEAEENIWEEQDTGKELDLGRDMIEADSHHDPVSGKQTTKADGHLESELLYWNRPVETDVKIPRTEVNKMEVQLISEEKEDITSWEDPKPQRERIDSDRSNSSRNENEPKSTCEIPHLGEGNEIVSSVSLVKSDTSRQKHSEQVTEIQTVSSVHVVENNGSKGLSEQLLESGEVVAKTVREVLNKSDVEDANELNKSCDDQGTDTLHQVGSAKVRNDVKDEINSEDEANLEDEEEFKSCDSDSESEGKQDKKDIDNPEQNPEDSFQSVDSSKDGINESENSNPSFVSDVDDESVEKSLNKSVRIVALTEDNNSCQNFLSDQIMNQSESVEDGNQTNIETTELTTENIEDEIQDSDCATTSETLDKKSEIITSTDISLSKVSDSNIADNKSNLQDSSPQKSSTPKKSKSSNRVRPGGKHIPFLGEDVKQKFQSENWSSYGKLANENGNSDASKFASDKPIKTKCDTRRSYSYTSARDFSLLAELNSGKPRAKIAGLDKYTVLLGKVREINLEANLRLKTKSGSKEVEKDVSKCSVLMLDKGSMAEEEEFQPQGDVDFLASSFPDADLAHLRETLAMCQGNVEWTLNLLLDWGVSEPFSSIEKEEICNEMKLKTVTSPARNIKTPEFECLRSPLSLFDICRDHIEANNLADIDELQKKLIKASKQRLDRMESHSYERVHSISVSESSFSIDNDSILSELTSRSALSSDVYISPEKVVSDNTDPSAHSKGKQLLPPHADHKGDWSLEDSWTEEERSMVDGDAHVMLPVPIELVRDLEELFGPVQSSLSDCEEFEVSLDLRTAKRLFDNLRRKPESRKALERKRREEELALQKQLKDDEAFARRLQEEEDSSRRSQNSRQEVVNPSQLLREAKAAALNTYVPVHHTTSGAGLSLINVRRQRGTVNLMDIMEEERTNQQRREEKIRRMESDRVAISTRLKRQKLTNQFPGMDENFLEEIFEANGYNLEDTVCVLQEAVGRGVSPRTRKLELSTPEREIKSSREEPISRRNLQDLIDDSWQSQGAGARYQSWDDAGVPEYEDIRGEANIHHQLRNECFQKAQEAFRRGMKDVASFYSQQGHLHTVKLKEANKRASEKILEQRSAVLLQQGTLDLHGFHVEEAINILNSVIQQREEEFQARPDRRKQSLFVITGRGRHSKGGVAKLRPAIINHLNNTGYRYLEQPTGMFKIQLQYRA